MTELVAMFAGNMPLALAVLAGFWWLDRRLIEQKSDIRAIRDAIGYRGREGE